MNGNTNYWIYYVKIIIIGDKFKSKLQLLLYIITTTMSNYYLFEISIILLVEGFYC